MTSSPNVVRSLSADELASPPASRQNNPPTTQTPQHAKPKTGLLKRFRKALRLNAQNVRTTRQEKSSRQQNFHQDSLTNSSLHHPSDPSNKIPPNSFQHQKMPAPRSRTWRGPLSSRHNNSNERQAPDITDSRPRRIIPFASDANKRSFVAQTQPNIHLNPTASASDSSKPSSSADGVLSSTPGNNNTNNHTSSASGTLPSHRIPRSLPKRVFSSPPSFTGRSFGFGGRKRNSVNGKNANRGNTFGPNVAEGDSDKFTKLNRSFSVRSAGYEGRGSMNFATVSPNGTSQVPSPQHSASAFRTIVENATAGRVTFATLLDAMFRLEERLQPDVKDMLIKFLSRQDNMEKLIDKLTVVLPMVGDDDGVEGPGGERERYRYSYVSCMLLSNGPMQLRRSLFLNPKHLDRLVRVLGHGTPSDPVVVRSVCKVLHSVLKDSPADTVRAMGRRKDFIDALLSHIAVTGCPEVCLAMLSTVRCQQQLKFGPSNKPVVGMMADSKLVKILCDKLAAAAENGPLNGTSSSTIENCSRVIVGIALRALVITPYDIDADDSDMAYMLKFNRDLASLDVFKQPTPILRLLDSGLKALSLHDTRGYALSTALTAVKYLLVTALNGQDSSLSTIRLQLMSVKTNAYEAGVRSRIPKMAKVLEHARNGVIVETMWEKIENPLGVVRLKILELIVVLLQHCSETTSKTIAKAEIPRIIMDLFERLQLNSLLQHFVAAIIELSFTKDFPGLRTSFIVEAKLIDRIIKLWEASEQTSPGSNCNASNYTGELLRIFCAVHDFFSNESDETRALQEQVGEMKMEVFHRYCDGPIAEKLKENGQLLSGPGDLPIRPTDNFGIDGYSSMGGSQGSLFLRSRGSGQVVNT